MKANAWITAKANERLDEISVDFGRMEIAGVTVNEVAAAAVQQRAGKLHVTPAAPLAPGTPFVLAVGYSGVPEVKADPSLGSPVGWIRTAKGSYTNLAPNGSGTWLPTNDTPGDKAVFRLRLTVSEPFEAVANGVPVSREKAAGRVTTIWEMPEPMAPSELQVTIGQLGRLDTTSPAGHALTNFVAAGVARPCAQALARGRPDDRLLQPAVRSVPVHDRGPDGGPTGPPAWPSPRRAARSCPPRTWPRPSVPISTVSSPRRSPTSGSALRSPRRAGRTSGCARASRRYARWLWMEEAGLQQVDDAAANALARTNGMRAAFGTPDQPSADNLSSPAVADGGAVVLHALRETVGDAKFFAILRRWVAEHHGRVGDDG